MHYKHITINEREKIDFLLETGKKHKEIALELNRHPTTIGREIERNCGKTGYRIPIYAWIKQDKNTGGEWYKELRQSSRKRRKRYASGTSKRGKIKKTKDIETRPAIIEKRIRAGDWESDTIEGAKGTGYVATQI